MGIIHDMNSLINGELRDIEPTGPHETVAGSIACLIYVEIFCSNFNWLVPETCLIKSLYADVTALRPDVVVLDKAELGSKPLWQKEPVICKDSTNKPVAEVIITNWQDDYARKGEKYAFLKSAKLLDFGVSRLGKFAINRLSQATYFHHMVVKRGSLPAATVVSLGRANLFLPISQFTIAT